MSLSAINVTCILNFINLTLIYRYKLMNEQQKIEAEQLAKEEREAKEELRRKQVKLEKPTEDTSLVNGIPGDVNLWNRVFY
jgi:hypothetical protein